MLQTLLAERFGLRIHRENRKFPSYALVAAKKGPKLQLNNTDADGGFTWGDGHLTCRAISMEGFASRLSGPEFRLGRPVVNMTGIQGAYDSALNWAAEDVSTDELSAPSIFTTLQEQLGLKLPDRVPAGN